ncbi:MAG: hypothetical protein AUJ18_10555 [Candidatus Hydrogenedentes bacterium CG1_02_42_14]|nr:MAG: hypothetical protein AUJ18_10555 [Candidatus Hydrogenedentes bacterium CG1_02_42_14]
MTNGVMAFFKRICRKLSTQLYRRAREIQGEIEKAANRAAIHPGSQHIQNIFREHRDRMFHWVEDLRVPAENNLAERQLRLTVIARKVSFGPQEVLHNYCK